MTKLATSSYVQYATIVISTILSLNVTLINSYDCSNFTTNDDTYRICNIFKDADMSSYSSWWLSGEDICNWGASSSYINCSYIVSENGYRLVKIDLNVNSGTLNLGYDWPDYIDYIDLSYSLYADATWGNFSNLPNNVYYLNLAYMNNLHGAVDLSTLPSSLKTLDLYYCYNLNASYDDLSLLPAGLEYFNVYGVSSLSESFDFVNLPISLEYLDIRYIGASGIVNLTNLPPNLYYLNAASNDFSKLLLPDSSDSSQNQASLTYLYLGNNKFDEDFSTFNFKSFIHLEYIGVRSNSGVYGMLDWSQFPSSLYWLTVESTGISGISRSNASIYYAKNVLHNLYTLDLGHNSFTQGTTMNDLIFPASNSMTYIYLNDAGLTGSVSFSVLPASLYYIDLNGNDFYGNITKATVNGSHLNNLETIVLTYNNLNGTVEWDAFENMSNLKYFYLSSNNLRGTIDWEAISQMPNLYSFDFHSNEFSGDIDLSSVNINLKSLFGYSNTFDGTIDLSGVTESFYSAYFHDNPYIRGGVNFAQISSSSSYIPMVYLDENIYCHPYPCCTDEGSKCFIPQNRSNPSTGIFFFFWYRLFLQPLFNQTTFSNKKFLKKLLIALFSVVRTTSRLNELFLFLVILLRVIFVHQDTVLLQVVV